MCDQNKTLFFVRSSLGPCHSHKMSDLPSVYILASRSPCHFVWSGNMVGRMAENRKGAGPGKTCVTAVHQWLKLKAKIPGRVCGGGYRGKGRFGAS